MLRALIPLGTLTLLASEVLLITSAFTLASYLTMEVDPTVYLLYDSGLTQIGIVVLTIVAGLEFHDLYSHARVTFRLRLLQQLCFTVGCAFLAQGLLGYLNPNLRVPIRVMMLGSALALPAMLGWRLVYSRYSVELLARQRLLLFGRGGLLNEIGKFIGEHPEMGLSVVGYIDDVHPTGAALPGGKCLGRASALLEIAQSTRPDRIVVGMLPSSPSAAMKDLLELQLAGARIEKAGATYERLMARVSINELRPEQLICSGEMDPDKRQLFYQNIAHVLIAAVALVFMLPIVLLIAAAVKLSSAGPVLVRERRIGLDGVLFTRYRFRTLATVPPAASAPRDTNAYPRLTPVGRFLRRFRLDQLPELYNVIRGDMAIAGPYPERPEWIPALSSRIPFYAQRQSVRPGMTGWAQIKREAEVEDTLRALEYDLYYIKNLSLFLDMYIIFYALKGVLLSPGEY